VCFPCLVLKAADDVHDHGQEERQCSFRSVASRRRSPAVDRGGQGLRAWGRDSFAIYPSGRRPAAHAGEVSPANHGILLLDEVPEFKRHVLEVLRHPLEDDIVTIARILLAATFPTHLTLLEAVYACSEGRRNPKRGCTGTPHLLPDLLPVSLPRPYALRYAVR